MSQRTSSTKSPRSKKTSAQAPEALGAAGRKSKTRRGAEVVDGTLVPMAAGKTTRASKAEAVAEPRRGKRAGKGSGKAETKAKARSGSGKPAVSAQGPSGLKVVEAPTRTRRTKAKAAPRPGKPGKRVYTAANSDPHELYQLAVQSPGIDAAFLAKLFKKLRSREARHVREDFCGTAYFISAWLRRNKENTGEGYDIDASTIQWGTEHNFEGLGDWSQRAKLFVEDVRKPSEQAPDVRFAPNFSWMIFTERNVLLDYFKRVRADLAEGGLFVFDIYGGWEAAEEMEEKRKIDAGFTYVWQQKEYHPATGYYHCAIHFRFKDGSELRDVYDYRWRLWSLPEVVDILKDAGFSQVDSYWEGTDADEVSGNGIFKRDARGENCPAWVTYVVAQG